jgi:hypothetical protein
MPSLLGTYVAANYGRMTSQDTYGGVTFSNFGTRNLAFIKVVASGSPSNALDFTAAAGPDTDADNTGSYTDALTNTWQDSNSYFSVAVRTIQQFAEVYFVGAPSSTSFVVAIAIDTANSAAAASNVEVFNTSYPTLGTFGGLAAQIATALGTSAPANSAAGSATVEATKPTITITQLTASGASIA